MVEMAVSDNSVDCTANNSDMRALSRKTALEKPCQRNGSKQFSKQNGPLQKLCMAMLVV
jgi:hypothetical protein